MPVGIPKCMAVSRLPRYLWLFSPCPPTPNISGPWLPSPSFSFPYNLPFQSRALSCLPLLVPSLLASFASTLFVFLSHSSPLSLLSRPGPVCWSCSVCYFLFLLWTLPNASDCSCPHIYNKTLPLSHTLEKPCPQLTQAEARVVLSSLPCCLEHPPHTPSSEQNGQQCSWLHEPGEWNTHLLI